MTVEANRDETGKFTPKSAPENGGLSQADADALERGDVAAVNEESDARLAMMKRARAKRAEEMGAEIVDSDDEEEAEVDKRKPEPADGAEAEEAPPGEEEKGAKGEEPKAVELADDAIVEVTVRGEKKKMPWGEAKKQLQIGAATEDTLEAAKAKLREAEADAAAAKAVRAVIGDKADAEVKPPALTEAEKVAKVLADAEAAKRAARRAHSEALRYGTDDEIKAAEEALDRAEAALDEAKFAKFKPVAPAEERDSLLDRETADTNRGTATYIEKFGKDQEDPLFRAAAVMYLRQETIADLTKLGADEKVLKTLPDQTLGEHHFRARSRGLVRSLDKLLDAAGTKSREELTRRSAPTPEAKDPRSERLSAKSNAPTQPRAASGRIPEPEEAKPPTNQELVAEARRRRGKG